jgi:nucleoside-diphosphate-sugar epimerase
MASALTGIDQIHTVAELEDMLCEPSPAVVEMMRRLPGDILFLGASGKIGPSLARMAKRASDYAGTSRRIIGVSRFSDQHAADQLEADGIETVKCDLLDEAAVSRLPDAPNVMFLVGMKFGATGNEAATWAMNSYLPGVICRRFRSSRIAAFSTGNIYGLVPVASNGSRENDELNPVGEYAMSCLGRERVFEYFSRTRGVPIAMIRLNYACEMRYGVLVDLAQKVWCNKPIDLSIGHFNILWQGDANAMALSALEHAATPPFVINVTGPELLNVRCVCERFGDLMNRIPEFTGVTGETALLSNAQHAFETIGQPRVSAEQLIQWIADWTMRGGPLLGKPTFFESREGKF